MQLPDEHVEGETSMFQADLLLRNGTVYPLEPAHIRGQAVSIILGRIFAVGDDSEDDDI